MSAAHTRGPWELKQFGGPQISGPKGYAVCTMWGALSVSELSGQDAANARLIAAAPDMLAALIAVRARFQSYNHGPDEQMVMDRVNAAIAKALGRTPNEIGDEG